MDKSITEQKVTFTMLFRNNICSHTGTVDTEVFIYI